MYVRNRCTVIRYHGQLCGRNIFCACARGSCEIGRCVIAYVIPMVRDVLRVSVMFISESIFRNLNGHRCVSVWSGRSTRDRKRDVLVRAFITKVNSVIP